MKMSTEIVFWIGKVKDFWMVRCQITKLDMHFSPGAQVEVTTEWADSNIFIRNIW